MHSLYAMYSKYYDRLNDNYDFWLPFIDKHIALFPAGSKIIEYGCGTGNILIHFKNKYDLTGVDISSSMLNQAKRKIPSGKFHLANIVTFKPVGTYDIALCLFDTVNHILEFDDWMKFFANAAKALEPRGIFILDANTTARLTGIKQKTVLFQKFDKNYFYLKTKRKNDRNIIFEVRILRHVEGTNYEEEAEEIEETTETGPRILSALKKYFSEVTPYNAEKEIINEDQYSNTENYRWFFICRK